MTNTTEFPDLESALSGIAGPQGEEADVDLESALSEIRDATGTTSATTITWDRVREITGFNRVTSRLQGTDVQDPIPLTRMGTITGGAIAGSVAGSRIPPAPGPAGAVVNPITGALGMGALGAFGGAIAPEATLELGEMIGAFPKGSREKYGLTQEELITLATNEALVDMYIGGPMQAAQFLTRGMGRVASGVNKENQKMAQRAADVGIDLPAAAVGQSRFSRFFTSVFGRFPLVGVPLRRAGVEAETQIAKAVKDLPSKVAPIFSETDIGIQVFKDARQLSLKTTKEFNRRYEALYEAAERADVRVTPANFLKAADDILAKIDKEAPAAIGGERMKAGSVLENVRNFITNDILPMRRLNPDGTSVQRAQTLRQMDGLVSKLDQEISQLEPKQRRFAVSLLEQLRTAANADVVENMFGSASDDFGKQLRALDKEYSETMRVLFETVAANKFQTFRKRGLRAFTPVESTRTAVDLIYKSLIKPSLDSPQVVDELSRIVKPSTFRKITSRVIYDGLEAGMGKSADGVPVFYPDRAAKALGTDKALRSKAEAIDLMLKKSGGLSMKEIQSVLDAAEAMRFMEVPDTSTFIARRGTIGGVTGIIRGLVPGAAIGTAAGATSGIASGVVGALMFYGGTRGMSSILASPQFARPLRNVMRQQSSRANWYSNAVRALRAGAMILEEEGYVDKGQGQVIFEEMRDAFIDARNSYKPL